MNGTRPATKWRCISARLGSAATNPPPGRSAGTVSGTCASDAQNYPFSRTSTKDPCSRHGFADRGKPRQTPRRRARRSRCVREIQGETIILAGGTSGLAAEWPRPRSGAYARRRRRPEKSGASCCARLNRPPGQRVACRHTGVGRRKPLGRPDVIGRGSPSAAFSRGGLSIQTVEFVQFRFRFIESICITSRKWKFRVYIGDDT